MRNINHARTRDYNIVNLLKLEIASTSVYLTNDEYLRKGKKFELAYWNQTIHLERCLSEISMDNQKAIPVTNSIVYAGTIPAKKNRNWKLKEGRLIRDRSFLSPAQNNPIFPLFFSRNHLSPSPKIRLAQVG